MNFKLIDNSKETIKAKNHAVEAALEAIGNQAVSYAKSVLAEDSRIDTGLLRNSLTHAVSGKEPDITEYKGDRKSQYGKSEEIPAGSYSGTAPKDPENKKAVYIGTNVDYAPYIEYGTDKITPSHFIQRAATEHNDEYRQIVEKFLKGS